jgi:hypothetical protein
MARHVGSPFRSDDLITAINDEPVEFCAVYAIGKPHGHGPVCIGYVENGHDRVRGECALEKTLGKFDGDVVLAVAWAVNWKLARRIVKRCHRILDSAHKAARVGGWFDIDATWAKRVIATAAAAEKIPIYSNRDLDRLRMTKGALHERTVRKRFGLPRMT